MQSAYYHAASRAMVSLTCDTPGRWTVESVRVPDRHRGRGLARQLMAELLADADAARVTLTLRVHPSPWPGCLTYEQLTAWYARLGFTADPQQPTCMTRPPASPKTSRASVPVRVPARTYREFTSRTGASFFKGA